MRVFCILILLACLASCDAGHSATNKNAAADASPNSSCDAATTKRHGVNFTCWYPGCFQDGETGASLDAVHAIGGNWLAIVMTWYQATPSATTISEHPQKSPTADDLRSVVALARSKGFHILLKPHVDVIDGSWRGDVAPTNLGAWQASYRSFLLSEARLAEELGIEIVAIGDEMKSRSSETAFWSDLISDLRDTYTGKLTYAANWDEFSAVQFWDQLDFIGIDFYYPLTDDLSATRAEMEAGLLPIRDALKTFSDAHGSLPFLFTEIGYRSVDGTNTRPYDYGFNSATDREEQADAFAAALGTFENESWVEGMFWWRWDPRLSYQDPEGYLFYNKPAADVVKTFWGNGEGACS